MVCLTLPAVLGWLVAGKRQKMVKIKGLGDYMINTGFTINHIKE